MCFGCLRGFISEWHASITEDITQNIEQCESIEKNLRKSCEFSSKDLRRLIFQRSRIALCRNNKDLYYSK